MILIGIYSYLVLLGYKKISPQKVQVEVVELLKMGIIKRLVTQISSIILKGSINIIKWYQILIVKVVIYCRVTTTTSTK